MVKPEFVRFPMVKVGPSDAFPGYVSYRLPDEVMASCAGNGLAAATQLWSFSAGTRHPFVTCEKAENGKLYVTAVSEGRESDLTIESFKELFTANGGLVLDIPEVK